MYLTGGKYLYFNNISVETQLWQIFRGTRRVTYMYMIVEIMQNSHFNHSSRANIKGLIHSKMINN